MVVPQHGMMSPFPPSHAPPAPILCLPKPGTSLRTYQARLQAPASPHCPAPPRSPPKLGSPALPPAPVGEGERRAIQEEMQAQASRARAPSGPPALTFLPPRSERRQSPWSSRPPQAPSPFQQHTTVLAENIWSNKGSWIAGKEQLMGQAWQRGPATADSPASPLAAGPEAHSTPSLAPQEPEPLDTAQLMRSLELQAHGIGASGSHGAAAGRLPPLEPALICSSPRPPAALPRPVQTTAAPPAHHLHTFTLQPLTVLDWLPPLPRCSLQPCLTPPRLRCCRLSCRPAVRVRRQAEHPG